MAIFGVADFRFDGLDRRLDFLALVFSYRIYV